MNWIKEHIKLLIIMIVIMVLVTIIVVSSLFSGSGLFTEKAVNTAVNTAARPVSAAGSGLSSFFSGLIHFRDIQRENYRLEQEMADLKEELADAVLTEYEYQELQNLYSRLNYSAFDDSYNKITASVVSIDSSDIYNIFTINAGSESGIKTEDIVVNADGLVGRVMSSGRGWAKVISLVDSGSSVSFTIARDPEIVGIINGNGSGSLEGYIFDESKSVIEGDSLISSGMGYFPAGIEIGKVTSVNIDSGTKQKTIEAESSVNFKSIRYVTVLVADGSSQQTYTGQDREADSFESEDNGNADSDNGNDEDSEE